MSTNRACQFLFSRTSAALFTTLRETLVPFRFIDLASASINTGLCKNGTIIAARPFSVCGVDYGRKAEALKTFVGKANKNIEMQMIYERRNRRKKANAKKANNELKTKLENRLEGDKLEQKVKEMVEMITKRLNLDEKGIIAPNTNIDYLLSIGFPFDVISKIAVRAPKALTIDLQALKRRIRVFKINSIYEESIVKILKRNPMILKMNVEDTLSQKVEAIRGLNLSLSVIEIVGILERCPDIIEYLNTSNLVQKVTFFKDKVGFTYKQLRKMIIKNPAVLTMNKESVKEKVDFCLANFNVTLDQISNYPRVLQCPMARLKERNNFLKQEDLSSEDIKIKGWAFKALAANSDVYFASKIANTPLKKFRDFQSKS